MKQWLIGFIAPCFSRSFSMLEKGCHRASITWQFWFLFCWRVHQEFIRETTDLFWCLRCDNRATTVENGSTKSTLGATPFKMEHSGSSVHGMALKMLQTEKENRNQPEERGNYKLTISRSRNDVIDYMPWTIWGLRNP